MTDAEELPTPPLDRLVEALEHSGCHRDMVIYVQRAADVGHTGLIGSLRTFYRGTGVHRMNEIGNPKEQALWESGAVGALDGHTWDRTNQRILESIVRDYHGVEP